MNTDRQPPPRQQARFGQQPTSFIGRLLTVIGGSAFLVLAFMFSLIALAVIAVGGLMIWGWLWWKTRAIRQQMQEMQAEMPLSGQVIEGEVIRENEPPARPGRLLR